MNQTATSHPTTTNRSSGFVLNFSPVEHDQQQANPKDLSGVAAKFPILPEPRICVHSAVPNYGGTPRIFAPERNRRAEGLGHAEKIRHKER